MNTPSNAFAKRAEEFFQRGVAAAKGGQRIAAAGLLRQAVRLNPQHERAWLWLSGVLDDHDDQAFCLQAVVKLNPHNERAQQGLLYLTNRRQLGMLALQPAKPVVNPLAEVVPIDAWWTRWREARSVRRQTLGLLWLIPAVLLVATMTLRSMVAAQPLPQPLPSVEEVAAFTAVVPTLAPSPTLAPEPTATAMSPQATAGDDSAVIVGYLGEVRANQSRLHSATDTYRTEMARSRTSIERAAAARNLRNDVARHRVALQAVEPPSGAAAAHTAYIEGLRLEFEALDDLLKFYTQQDVGLANRAALGLQDARAMIDKAKHGWAVFAQQFRVSLSEE